MDKNVGNFDFSSDDEEALADELIRYHERRFMWLFADSVCNWVHQDQPNGFTEEVKGIVQYAFKKHVVPNRLFAAEVVADLGYTLDHPQDVAILTAARTLLNEIVGGSNE